MVSDDRLKAFFGNCHLWAIQSKPYDELISLPDENTMNIKADQNLSTMIDDNLYDRDYLQWIDNTVDRLRSQNYNQVDWGHLIEEIEAMSRRERKAMQSNLIVLFLHLLKWQYQSELRSGSWRGSIVEHRQRLTDDLEESPSLKSYLHEVWDQAYSKAVVRAAAETGLSIMTFPTVCAYSTDQVLDLDFLP